MYSDVEAIANILEYLITHSLIFRLSIIVIFSVSIFYFISWIRFLFNSKDIKEDSKDEV